MNFEDLIAKVKTCGKQKLAVAAAEDDAVLEAVDAAHKQGIADAILVGDEAAIRKIAAELNIDLSDYEIINEPDKVQASLKAVKLAHDGVANMYMKGLLDTKTFLKSVLDKEVGLRTGNTLSHVAVFEVKGIEQLLFLTDVAFMTYPTLEDKVHIIENTVAVAHACGVECPKVAPLAAVEVVNPKMPCTVAAAELRKLTADPEKELASIEYWSMGSLAAVTRSRVWFPVPVVLVCCAAIFALHRQALLLSIEEGEARLLGVRVGAMRLLLLTLATMTVAAVVSVTGLISFVGLLAPHSARLLAGHNRRSTCLLSGLLGSALLLAADTLAKTAASTELPVSIFTSLLGVPFLLYLILQPGRDAS